MVLLPDSEKNFFQDKFTRFDRRHELDGRRDGRGRADKQRDGHRTTMA